jgi:hypothetical protein
MTFLEKWGKPCVPMRCGEYVIEIRPRPGYASSECGGTGCRYNGGVWFFERKLGAVSSASISLPKTPQCCPCTPKKWRDELVFYRFDEQGDLCLQWVGPVVDVQDNNTENVLSIFARDRSTWVIEENPLPQSISGITETATDRFRRIWNLVNALDPSYLQLQRVGSGLGATIGDDVSQWASTLPEIAKLAGFGTYWTVVGDEVLYGDLASLNSGVTLDPSSAWDNDGTLITDSGLTSISALIVRTRDGRNVIYPPNPTPDPCEGLHIRTINPEFELPGEEADTFARLQYELWKDQGLQIATSVDSSLSKKWPVCMSSMAPGMVFTVDTSAVEFCLNASTSAQLGNMTVEGKDCKETAVKVNLAPQTGVTSSIGGAL